MPPEDYSYRRATLDDLPLLRAWLAKPHVRQWWNAGEPYDSDALADTRVARLIVSTGARPFAYMQDYALHGWAEHHFAGLPEGSRGIDQYIGEPAMLGRGHGPGFIAARMAELFEAGAPVIATDPHPENARAIAAYSKLGFEPVGPPQNTAWGPILPMIARR